MNNIEIAKIDKLKEEIEFLKTENEELNNLIKDKLNVDEKKKLLKLEIIGDLKKTQKINLAIILTFISLLLGTISIFGIQSIKQYVLKNIDIESIKRNVLSSATNELKELKNTKSEVLELKDEIESIKLELIDYQAEFMQLYQTVDHNSNKTNSILEALPDKIKREISANLPIHFSKLYGISNETLIKILQYETNLSVDTITRSNLFESIKMLQNKYNLETDGILGSATELIVASIAYRLDSVLTTQELKTRTLNFEQIRGIFHMSFHDRDAIRNILADKNHFLHIPIRKVLDIKGLIGISTYDDELITQFYKTFNPYHKFLYR